MTVTFDRPNCPSVFEAGLPTIDYTLARSPGEAHAVLRRARAHAPIAIGPHGPELLTYELVRSVLRDSRFRMPEGMILAAQGITSGPLWDRVANLIISLDGASHQRLRRLVAKAFTPRATARLRTIIVDVVSELVDRLSDNGRCDVVTDIARQYPIPIICALLGAKPQDWQLFSDWTDDIFKAFTWNAAERPELAAGAVEETMRHSPITFATFRAAIEDVELAGVRIPAGTMVIANTGAANRDPAVYTDPDVLDITRTGAPALLTFGGGMHYCLGAHLARLELAEALTVMTRRMPNARRTGPAPWKPLTGLSGPHTLPIEFDPGY